MSFTAFIKKQEFRNNPLGDYAIDFKYILDNLPLHPECRGTDEIPSETLYGHYSFLLNYAKNRDYIQEALCDLWKEWLEYKHIGLKFGKPKRGYVYIFKLKNADDVYKIGRTQQDPEKRLIEVSNKEKATLSIFDWMQIDFFDVIEKELHTAFKKHLIMREWFQIDKKEIEEAIRIYSLTDEDCVVNSYQEYEDDNDDDDFIPPCSC